MDILEHIVEIKKSQLDEELDTFGNFICNLPRRNFANALKNHSPAVIAEIKYASPAKGNFGVNYSPEELAKLYQAGGACAISVLACRPFFEGSPSFVYQAKKATLLPILWKDFIFDTRQIKLAADYGADAILLICAVVKNRLPEFLTACKTYDIEPVVEVFNSEEAKLASDSGAKIILINNRNLRTMSVDLNVSKTLKPYFEPETTVISASGIKSAEDIINLQKHGINIFLVGESISCSKSPDITIRRLTQKQSRLENK